MLNYDYMNFIPNVKPSNPISNNDLCLVFFNKKFLFIKENTNLKIATRDDIKQISDNLNDEIYLGKFKNIPCYLYKINKDIKLHNNLFLKDLKVDGEEIGKEVFDLCSRAFGIINWNDSNKFCSKCGSTLINSKTEIAKTCSNCNSTTYQIISPAIIVSITKGDKILLASNKNFKDNLYSVVSGFVDIGEDFETCVKREVFEEVGIKVKNIKYFGDQPWPFPASHMIAFTAEYESGEIKVDGEEIVDANWFSVNSLPRIPSTISIARKMIDSFIKEHKK